MALGSFRAPTLAGQTPGPRKHGDAQDTFWVQVAAWGAFYSTDTIPTRLYDAWQASTQNADSVPTLREPRTRRGLKKRERAPNSFTGWCPPAEISSPPREGASRGWPQAGERPVVGSIRLRVADWQPPYVQHSRRGCLHKGETSRGEGSGQFH